jgi:hypothetical protein
MAIKESLAIFVMGTSILSLIFMMLATCATTANEHNENTR